MEAKFHFHFYYFSRSGKKQVDSATDLKGRFDSLKSQCDLIDFVEDTEIRIETINSIFMLIKQGREFKYTFKMLINLKRKLIILTHQQMQLFH